jgi:hypothetical protein
LGEARGQLLENTPHIMFSAKYDLNFARKITRFKTKRKVEDNEPER